MAIHRLTVNFVRKVQKPGRYTDGRGLHMLVNRSGGKYWVQRVTIAGRQRDIGLGPVHLVTLTEARDQAYQNARTVRAGGDPLSERRKSKIPTFREAMDAVIALRSPGWAPLYRRKWRQQLEKHAVPVIGDLRVDAIEVQHVLALVGDVWHAKPKLGRELRARVAMVLDWAVAQKFRADNPARDSKGALSKQRGTIRHHAAINHAKMPDTVRGIESADFYVGTALALRFLILAAARSGEVRGATWKEIDFTDKVWTIPASRMKSRREHLVPLADAAMSVLREAGAIRQCDLIFPGARGGQIGLSSFSRLLQRVDDAATVHGCRSTFRDWAGERTNTSREIVEMCLAHAIGSRAERAYARSDLLAKRRTLMDRWASYVTAKPADVVRLHR